MNATKLDRTRQRDLISERLFKGSTVTLIGAGGIGSPTALLLSKMGVEEISIWDEDGVSSHNIPNSLYKKSDVGKFKVDALSDIIGEFGDSKVSTTPAMYTLESGESPLETVIVATDSMASRRIAWTAFILHDNCHHYIEARMGAKLGMVYTFSKVRSGRRRIVRPTDMKFYEARLYSDESVKPLPCTGKAIIYNTGMISALICRAYEAILTGEKKFPRELIFNMTRMDKLSWMVTQ